MKLTKDTFQKAAKMVTGVSMIAMTVGCATGPHQPIRLDNVEVPLNTLLCEDRDSSYDGETFHCDKDADDTRKYDILTVTTRPEYKGTDYENMDFQAFCPDGGTKADCKITNKPAMTVSNACSEFVDAANLGRYNDDTVIASNYAMNIATSPDILEYRNYNNYAAIANKLITTIHDPNTRLPNGAPEWGLACAQQLLAYHESFTNHLHESITKIGGNSYIAGLTVDEREYGPDKIKTVCAGLNSFSLYKGPENVKLTGFTQRNDEVCHAQAFEPRKNF